MDSTLRVIVTGLMATHRFQGGVAWDYLNFVLAVKRLGHEVFYLEDMGGWPYNLDGGPSGNDLIAYDPKPTVEYLASLMAQFDLSDRWAYHFPTRPEWFGLTQQKREEIIQSADVLLNVSGSLEEPERYRRVKRLVYIDTDPVFTQIKAAGADPEFRARVNTHDVHFSFGECVGEDLPDTGHRWIPLRQPVVLDEWRCSVPHRDAYTTIMNWTSYEVARSAGRTYGQKDVEFMKFMELPQRVFPTSLEVALHKAVAWPANHEMPAPGICDATHNGERPTPHETLNRLGWRIVDPMKVCPDFRTYRRYIQTSKGEWSVAKNAYVDGNSGWFSCRSACYLAAGRPVVVQDTGFSRVLPVGKGIMSFKTLEEAESGIREIEANYHRHVKAATEIAEAYFDSAKVVSRLLRMAMDARV